ncbi:MAG: DUF4190 domain-containing protein [Myxococcaceae bacterium]|nr:DUF4190 domain-containing protein [Myxococcaceae bacterium]
MTPIVDQPQNPPVKYSLPLIAMVLSIAGICFCPTALVGAILGIVAWVRISKEPHLPGKGFAIAATFIPLALVPIVGIQAAIVIPNFIRFQARSKQAECKTQLKSLWVAQRMFHEERHAWAGQFGELAFRPEQGNRYSYFLTATEVILADPKRAVSGATPPSHVAALHEHGIEVGVSDEGFTAACVGNIDNDPVLDIWTISSEDRMGADGVTVPAGTPVNVLNDVTES